MTVGSAFDVRLANNTICDNEPDDVSGLWIDEGGNSFCDCVGDLDGDGAVDGADLTQVLGKWGACGDGSCDGDLTGDGIVDGADLTIILGSWGPCDG